MLNERLTYLLNKYAQGKLTPKEKDELNEWYHSLNYDRTEYTEFISRSGGERKLADQMFEDFSEKIKGRKKTKYNYIYRRVIAAAAIVAIISSIVLLKQENHRFNGQKVRIAKRSTIVPGGNSAVLFLQNGEQIDLSTVKNGELLRQNGLAINKTQNGKIVYQNSSAKLAGFNTIVTPNGGQYQIVLSDGTKVWLNSGTTLNFPVQFSSSERIVKLSGEAYFEVAQDKSRPFKVINKKQTVTVLGTHFNVNSYDNETFVKTTLVEGSVLVKSLAKFADAKLTPGSQSVLTNGVLTQSKTDVNSAVAWKNGFFSFSDEDIHVIMNQISRWYDVEVVFEDSFEHKRFGAYISRGKSIKEILDMMQATKGINFKIEGRIVKVMK